MKKCLREKQTKLSKSILSTDKGSNFTSEKHVKSQLCRYSRKLVGKLIIVYNKGLIIDTYYSDIHIIWMCYLICMWTDKNKCYYIAL
jgi:hypothetical protein